MWASALEAAVLVQTGACVRALHLAKAAEAEDRRLSWAAWVLTADLPVCRAVLARSVLEAVCR